jgi:wyosine [tRNA(Phe)-imidazoG37] synthetase (radical SAM superfamily)
MQDARYIFGPVPSRRLGLSLGVDIVPFKTCTLDCIYCQLGPTPEKTIERKDYVPVEAVLAELRQKLAEGIKADFITISGSGEPTLNIRLGEIIKGIKKITEIPVAILTNGTLFTDRTVRADCALADVVLPSLDAADERTFRRINRPGHNISIKKVISGLIAFRDEFAGRLWLEVFLVDGVNTDNEQIAEIKKAVERIRPDKVHLNTAVRPTAVADVKRVKVEKLRVIAKKFGPNCEVVAELLPRHHDKAVETRAEDVLSILKRRPCSLNDICTALGIHRNEALKHISHLQQQGLVYSQQKDQTVFFKAR